jgi:hypothetical protein
MAWIRNTAYHPDNGTCYLPYLTILSAGLSSLSTDLTVPVYGPSHPDWPYHLVFQRYYRVFWKVKITYTVGVRRQVLKKK